MHSPCIVLSVFGNIHDDLAEAATDATFFNGTTETLEAVSVGKLRFVRSFAKNTPGMYAGLSPCFPKNKSCQTSAFLQYSSVPQRTHLPR